jgi:hypothetical protein
VYSFVQRAVSARENALGATALARSGDVALTLKNPSLLDSSLSRSASLTWGNMFALQTNGTSIASVSYAHPLREKLMLVGGISSVIYGSFHGYDEDAHFIGYFSASDNVLTAGICYQFLPNFYAGVSLKPVLSFLESYSSVGVLADFAVRYRSIDTLTNATIIVRNAGSQISTYTGVYEDIPFGVDVAIRQKLKYAPFAISFAYSDVQQFALSGNDNSFVNNLLKHISLASDVRLFKRIDVMAGFNFRKFQDLTWDTGRHAVGLSFGAAYERHNWKFGYGYAKQHAAGGTHFFTVSANMQHVTNTLFKQNTL